LYFLMELNTAKWDEKERRRNSVQKGVKKGIQ
jgi:hypothetical protein